MLLNNQLSVFEEFLKDYSIGFTGSFIAKKKNLNQKSTSNFLKKLEQERILKSIMQGKNKLYFLNLNNSEIVKNYLIAVEHLRCINFYKGNILIKEIAEKIQEHIKGIAIIFGSYAKNTQKEASDLDLFIIGKCNEQEINKLSKIYKLEINIKIYPKLEHDILTKEVFKNHIIIKNVEPFIEENIKWIKLNGV